ncbi:LysE family translocator, partial [Salinisphaera sp. USBA-960]|nr:LysE family translocator [Salifodinibacter halophilus]
MSFETWLAFSAASFVMLAIPGPTILLVVSYALAHGRAVASATVIGV